MRKYKYIYITISIYTVCNLMCTVYTFEHTQNIEILYIPLIEHLLSAVVVHKRSYTGIKR